MKRRAVAVWMLLIVPGCGDNLKGPADAGPMDAIARRDAPIDVSLDAPVDAAQLVRVFGHVDFNGDLPDVTVSLLGSSPQTAMTDLHGDFYFDVPDGSRAIYRAVATSRPELMPMIRGVIAHEDIRPRVFYLVGPPDVTNAAGLGITFDPAAAIVEVDYRNAAIGGYGATLMDSPTHAVVPAFGIAYDGSGQAQLSQTTVSGGDGSTLLLGGLAPGSVTFGAIVPAAATLPCQPRDANPLPLEAGVVTWFDFECGNGTD